MPRGGRRPGAGRPKGSKNKRTSKIIEAAMTSGKVTPLEIMLEAMYVLHNMAHRDPQNINLEHLLAASERAERLARFFHPTMQAISVTGKDGGPVQHEVTHEIKPEDYANTDPAELAAYYLQKARTAGQLH